MSADNVVTVLSTPTATGRAYRVAHHADSGSPIFHYTEGDEDGPWKTRVTDADYAVVIFRDATVFEDASAALQEAYRLEDDIGFVEYGVSSADLDETWEQLLVRAEATRERRKSCHLHKELPEGQWHVCDYDSIDWWSPNYVVKQLEKLGWTRTEALMVCEHLWDTYEGGDGGPYPFPDRLRLARIGNAAEMEAFQKVKQGGCCSCYEHELVVDVDGGTQSRILIGFNYGH